MHEERFSSMRAILLKPPSTEGWSQLIELFEDWEVSDGIEVAIQYANEHLDANAWPAELRQAPGHWCRVLLGDNKSEIKRNWRRGERTHPAFAITRRATFPYIRQIKPKHIKYLHKADSLNRVEIVEFNALRMGDDGATHLAECTQLTAMRQLLLGNNNIGPQGIRDLVDSNFFQGLTSLDVSNRIGDEGLRELAQCQHLTQLTHFGASNADVSDKGIGYLAQSPYITQVTSLNLSDNQWYSDAACIDPFANTSFIERIETLQLAGLHHSAEFWQSVSQLAMPALRELTISRCHMTLADIETLIASDTMQQLNVLRCSYIEEDLQRRLIEHFGDVAQTEHNS